MLFDTPLKINTFTYVQVRQIYIIVIITLYDKAL